MTCPAFYHRIFRIQTPLWLGCFFLCLANILAEPKVVNYSEVPTKFDQYQDSAGFLWQANKEGSLASGETQYLPSGLKLFINDKAFQPQTARLSEDSAAKTLDLELNEKDKVFQVTRQFWFDLERSGVRVLDTINNLGGNATFKIELKSAFQFPWQNLIGTNGQILPGSSKVDLGMRDWGVTAKFSAADGRQDTLILARGDGCENAPEVSASSNSRELIFTYNISIPAGQSVSLVHWIARRNFANHDLIGKVTQSFYERRQLVNPRIPSALTKTIRNFSSTAIPESMGPPPKITQLITLNERLKRLEIERKNQDIFWISANNQIAGTVAPTATVQLGEVSVPIVAIAAIEGGGGIGKVPRIFLRTGSVLVGEMELKNFAFKVDSQWSVDKWDPHELNLLLLALNPADGTPPANTTAFVELRSGEVYPVSAFKPGFALVSVWGQRLVQLSDIFDLQYISRPRPEYRANLADGSSLSILPTKAPLQITLAPEPKSLTIDPRTIQRIWKSGGVPLEPVLFEPRWTEHADIPEGLIPTGGFLLQGNNLLAGGFGEASSITLIDGNSAFDVAPGQIAAMRKLDPTFKTSLPQFEIELTNGDVIKGGISQPTLLIGTGKENWPIPVRQIIFYQSAPISR